MNYFFTQLRRSVGVFFRTIRSFIRRRLTNITATFRRMTNFSRHATKLATDSIQEVVSAAQKPSGPSDYVQTGHLLISKALIIKILLAVVALALIIYFLVWPFVLSHFLTAKFFKEDKRVPDWSGRVIVYSDKKKTVPLYSGRLEDGVLQGECKQYDSQGLLLYEGQVKDGVHDGKGKIFEKGILVYDGQLTAGIYNGRGKRYVDGKLLYDGQYVDGRYSGAGTLYEEDGDLLYEGQFLDNLYEGRGKLYEDGTLLYSGNFHAGIYEGTGKLYEDGTLRYDGGFQNGIYQGDGALYEADGDLLYEGAFQNGTYNGTGKLYEDGVLLYEGQFQDGIYEGSGKLYQDSLLRYDGGFHGGVEEGMGTAYYPNGKVSYQGEYLAGKYDGIGTAYTATGREEYTGGFADGQYSGDGILFYADGSQIEARFQEGEPTGIVTWKKNGKLYYQGEWADGVPSGFGALYSQAERKLYEGPFLGGTIDGLSLLEYTTDQLRDALCESTLHNDTEGVCFRMYAEELGLTALCTYQVEDGGSQVYQIYLTPPEKNNWIELLPGTGNVKSVVLPEGVTADKIIIIYTGHHALNIGPGNYYSDNAVANARRTTALYTNEKREKALLLTWERQDIKAGALDFDGVSGNQVEKLLEAMDKMIGSEGTVAGTGVTFGGEATDNAFEEIADVNQAVSVVDAMVDYWEQSQRLNALQEVADRIDSLLEDAQRAAAKGTGSADKVTDLQKRQTEINLRIENSKTAIKRAELEAGSLGIENLGSYALEEMLVSFNPAEQDVSGLVLFASTYAKATGSSMDDAAIEKKVKEELLNLADAHGAAKLALTYCQTLAENSESAMNDYSMGLGTKEAWYEAMNAESLARVDLYAALSDFSKQANLFNQLTGGWVSRTFDWHADVFEPLFQAAYEAKDAASGSGDSGSENPHKQYEPNAGFWVPDELKT